jgi:hypothetical protein
MDNGPIISQTIGPGGTIAVDDHGAIRRQPTAFVFLGGLPSERICYAFVDGISVREIAPPE